MNFDLSQHAVLAAFNVTRPKITKVDKKLSEEQRAQHAITQRKTVKTVKDLYGDELAEIEGLIWSARKAHYHMTLNWVTDGAQLLPAKMYMEYVTTMRKYKQQIESIVQSIDYGLMMQRRRIALNGAFNEGDYPDETTFKRNYAVSISITPVPASDTLNALAGMMDDEIKLLIAENERRILDATQVAMKSAWDKLYEVVQHVAETLKDGKCSKVYDSLIGNVTDIINILPMLNITNDPVLNDLSDKIKTSLCSISTDSLKKDEARQKEVAKQAQDILDKMSGYMGVFS